MMVIHARAALLPEGWRADVRLTLAEGRIAAVASGAAPAPGEERAGLVLPGLCNLHSHAFQRGMAGLAERRGTSDDSFWTWRDTMYRFAGCMDPEATEAVAAQAYMEMLEAGFTRVGEFHYVHHQPDGRPYADVAELAVQIAAAAAQTGLGLTLLPVLYARSGFGGTPPTPGQRRFVCSPDGYARLLERCQSLAAALPEGVAGVAAHSLRAVTPAELDAAVALAGSGPVHIHVAEQRQEVADCLAWSGARPVQWLLDHAPVDGRWCLVHATHMTDAETQALARRGAVAGLCPVTEANLGDGTFPAPLFLSAGGRFGVGTDSNVAIDVAGELRQLEYSQRLAHGARNVLAAPGGSTGRFLFEAARAGGAAALGAAPGGLAPGTPADLVALDPDHDALVGRHEDSVLDSWMFGAGRPVETVWVAGRKVVAGGRHRDREAIGRAFRAALRRLTDAM